VLFLWEGEEERTIREVLSGEMSSIGLIVGPEGGFSTAEAREAVTAGCKAVSLGRRILRMETAAITAAALALYTAGDLG
jgi:16S rRNA (uracil1498-N3)-methyltransferase